MKLPPRVQGLLWWAAAGLALTLTSLAYTQTDLVVDLASRVWACF